MGIDVLMCFVTVGGGAWVICDFTTLIKILVQLLLYYS